MEIRRVVPDEWRELRDTRLDALLDVPDAFGGSYDVSAARPDDWWVAWARKSAESDEQAMFLAWSGEDPIGIAGTFRDDRGSFVVIAMWVRPPHRGQGLGRRLLDAVVGFIRTQGVSETVLGVADGNDGARRLYEGYGFVATGTVYPLREGSQIDVHELKLKL